MKYDFSDTKAGLALALFGLIFGITLGVSFGINEDPYKLHVANGIAAHPALHDAISQSAIVRWAVRAHFHAMGIGAFTLGLITVLQFSNVAAGLKRVMAVLLGLGNLYPLAWLSMFWFAPEMGRKAAHEHWLVLLFTYVGVGGVVLGILLFAGTLFRQQGKPA
jgi:hypothetical protein